MVGSTNTAPCVSIQASPAAGLVRAVRRSGAHPLLRVRQNVEITAQHDPEGTITDRDSLHRAEPPADRSETDALIRLAATRGAQLRALDADPIVRAARIASRLLGVSGAAVRRWRQRVAVASLRAIGRSRGMAPRVQATSAARTPPPTEARPTVLLLERGRTLPPTSGIENLTVVQSADPASVERALSTGGFELLAVLADGVEPVESDWLARLSSRVGRDGVGAAAGTMIMDGWGVPGRVSSRGLDASRSPRGVAARRLGVGADPHRLGGPARIDAAEAGAVVFAVDDLRRGGLPPRPASTNGLVVGATASLTAVGRTVLTEPGVLLRERHVPNAGAFRRSAAPLEGAGPMLRRARAGSATDVSIVVAAPSARVAPRWGDWHLAEGLRRSLLLAGASATVRPLTMAGSGPSRAADVQLVLRGLAPVTAHAGQRQVLWIISHPETVATDELDAADLVLAASDRLAVDLRRRTRTRVETFLQATDHRRFRPRFPDRRYRHDVAAVAKTRDAERPIVLAAVAAGLRPAIYGSGWEGLVPPDLVVGGYVANDDLPTLYSSVDILLNDHWPTMRAHGIVSNRIFDALACGTPVVSDHLPEIEALFDDAVTTCGATDVASAVARVQADPAAAKHRAAQGRARVLAQHTFDHRAATLLAILDEL